MPSMSNIKLMWNLSRSGDKRLGRRDARSIWLIQQDTWVVPAIERRLAGASDKADKHKKVMFATPLTLEAQERKET